MRCGLLGRKLGHSYSPLIHSMLGSYEYVLFEKEPHHLEEFLRCTDFTGCNVTIPYKKDVIPFLDELSPVARKLGAVNTIVRSSDGKLVGHNTDYYGFQSLLARSGIQVSGKKVLVLGSGGASNTAVHVLKEQGADVVVISRSGVNNYENIHIHEDASVIVNTTPVGMYPNAGVSPVSLDSFRHLSGVIDVIYNPSKTKLLQDAEERDIPCINGLWMLVAQAKEASEWFTGKKADDGSIEHIHRVLNSKMRNVVLIGMPGCGKSSVASLLSEKMNRPVFDSDAHVQQVSERSIPDIISTDGEATFRHLETQALRELGQKSGIILATGGGCVTIPENEPLLRQNGTVIWIQRDIDLLPTDGRPLSQTNKLSDLYQKRKPLYSDFSDFTIVNNGEIRDAVNSIIKLWEDIT